MDYLAAQASSVPAERVFSSSAETDTRRRNRISPELMEQLQMLKYMVKKARLNFTSAWKCEAEDLELENECQDGKYQLLDKQTDEDFGKSLEALEDELDNVSTGSDDDDDFSMTFNK